MGHRFVVDDLVLTREGNSNVERLWRVRRGLGCGFVRRLTTSATSGTFRQIGNGHDNSRAKPLDSLGFHRRIMIGPCFALLGSHSSGDCHFAIRDGCDDILAFVGRFGAKQAFFERT